MKTAEILETAGIFRRREWARTACCEAFCTETFPHLDAIYADALCLTGTPEDAASLVEDAYVRAFSGYEQFRRRRCSTGQRPRITLAWLYTSLYAVFCDTILLHNSAQAARIEEGRGLESNDDPLL